MRPLVGYGCGHRWVVSELAAGCWHSQVLLILGLFEPLPCKFILLPLLDNPIIFKVMLPIVRGHEFFEHLSQLRIVRSLFEIQLPRILHKLHEFIRVPRVQLLKGRVLFQLQLQLFTLFLLQTVRIILVLLGQGPWKVAAPQEIG